MNHFSATIPIVPRTLLRKPILTFLCLFFTITLHAQLAGLTESVNLRLKTTSAAQVIRELDKQSKYSFTYASSQLEKIRVASFVYEKSTLGRALQALQSLAGLEFDISGNFIAVRVTASTAPQADPTVRPGKITGTVRNEKNEGMPGVSLLIDNLKRGATTFVSGDYVISLPPGEYSMLVSFIGYTARRITGIVVRENEVTDLNLVLDKEDPRQLQTVVVTGGARKESVRALLLAQKNNAAISDGISAEQIRITPDNNTAQVLKRVSGLTVQNNKFVTIRGVSDRYNNVLINGSSLPSTEPNRRNFSFDIVPSALVDNVVINKTATPDLSSEFTGGIVQINTKDVPARNFLEFTIGSGFNTESINRDFVGFKRDEKAWMGKVDDNRKWFGDGKLFDPARYMEKVYANDMDYQKNIGKQIPNRWQLHKNPYTPVQNYQLSGGINKSLPKGRAIGFVAAVTYRQEQLYEEGDSRVVDQSDTWNERYQYTTAIGGLANLAYKTTRHKISWKNLYNGRYSNTFNHQAGGYPRYSWWANRRSEVTLTSGMLQSRLEGEHVIGKIRLKADWYADYVRLLRDQPDTRFLTGRSMRTFSRVDSMYNTSLEQHDFDFLENTTIRSGLHSSRLEEIRKTAGANITLPFQLFNDKHFFKTGFSWSERTADFDASNIIVQNGFNGNSYTLSKYFFPYYEIVTPEAFERGDLKYQVAYPKSGTTGDSYSGTQTLKAGYAMLDLHVLKQIRLTGGLRYEDNGITMSTVFYNRQGYSEFRDTTYQEADWLPSANITYSVTPQLNIRAAYSKTLARPDFVERSPYTYFDFYELASVIGRQSLKYSRINNYDFRVEYYPSGSEILSASVFYKEFENPVERFYYIGDVANIVEYQNLHSATARGFEVDVRKSLSFINPQKDWLSNLYISSNFTYLKGDIKAIVTKTASGKDTNYVISNDRPIQGLSPYIINGGLLYQAKGWGVNIAYNRFGRRIVNGGTDPELVQYENPRDVLDLQLTTRLMKQKMEVRLNFSDLLNQYYIIYCNYRNPDDGLYPDPPPAAGTTDPKGDAFNPAYDFINYKVKKGVGITLNVTYKF
ncbi:MAG: TonB-dependent receptor [Candidatus Pseudobacter hemicellulosilyticus]|uniref:TonB-dependent receptor n=1 Tax=Candidatus Pseudobacter hemicellulosilyticus TaxID=3121375 RepID=A0AAJ5WRK6_9BACT|nr:MAG: TonB-dependent receptor [Pseudobacter sp.]